MILRVVAAIVGFLLAAFVGVAVAGGSLTEYEAALGAFPWITAVAVVVAIAAYAGVELAQTGRIASITRQFQTRTIVLMPIAIAINIVLGQAVAAALKIPIYLDSIGTILLGLLAGPIAGAVTGLLSNLLWTYVVPPPFQSSFAAPFAITAVVIGLLAGIFGRVGLLRRQPGSDRARLVVAAVVALAVLLLLGGWVFQQFYSADFDLSAFTFFNPDPEMAPDPVFVVVGWLIAALLVGALVGLLLLLFGRRDAAVAYAVVAGAVTGVVAAILSAPIAANLFGGVTGAGTDFLVAFFRGEGADILTATFRQGLISDPIDKIATFLVVYVLIAAMPITLLARFPQGDRLLERRPAEVEGEDEAGWREATA